MNIRSTAVSIHRWTGLTIGLLGLYMAATGAWMLYRPQLDARVHPSYLASETRCATRISLDTIATAARTAHPASPVDSVWPKGDPSAPVIVRYDDSMQAYYDACTGALLGLHSRWAGTFGFVEHLHRFRFFEKHVSELTAGVIATGMASFLTLLGLYLWWPRRRAAWKASLRFNPSLEGRARMRNRHSVVGAVVAPLLLVVSVAGTALAFEPVEALLYLVSGSEPIEKPLSDRSDQGPVAYQAAWSNILAVLPQMPRDATLRPPKKPGRSLEIYLTETGSTNPEGRTYFYADATSGRILKHIPYAQTPAGQRAYSWLLALHKGEVGGPAGQFVTLLVMLGTIYLGYSGIRGWLMRNRKRGAKSESAPLSMRIDALTDEAEGVRSFRLAPVDGRPLPVAEAGSHVELRLPDGKLRQYSLLNGPHDCDHYLIAVRAAPEGRGGSLAMHALSIGCAIETSRPRNHFPLAPEASFVILVAGGIGITPLLSMARHLVHRGIPFELHYFARSEGSMAFRATLLNEAAEDELFLYTGLSRDETARSLDTALAARQPGSHLYTCGPNGFMDTVFQAARSNGWPMEALHREAFGGDAAALARPKGGFDVMLARSGRTVSVGADDSMLDALVAAGLPMASSCEQGVCGSCEVRVLSGEIDHRDNVLSEKDRCSGERMMACVSRAKTGSLVVDL